MPLIDLPLSQLQTYAGRNPKPEDHADYWDRALEEMRGVDPELELRPASFQVPTAECFDLYFTGVRGARVHAKYVRPASRSGPGPAVVQFHGYSGDAGDWSGLLRWTAAGVAVAAMDCRGQGGQSQDPGGVKGTTLRGHIIRGLDADPSGDDLLFRHIFLDTAQLAGLVMAFDEVDAARVGAVGGSQGGGLTLACAALEPRIARAAPYYPFLCDYLRVWEMDQARAAYDELAKFFRHHDPTHARKDEWFRRLGYIDVQHLADRVRGPVLMGCGLMDTVCPPSTQFAAYNKITAPKDVVIYPDFAHEHLPGFEDRTTQFMLES
jgi:cephalosporin-C deacetylase